MIRIVSILFFLQLSAPVLLIAQSFQYVVHGKIAKSAVPLRAFLVYNRPDGSVAADSTDVKNGLFTFKAETANKESQGFIRVSEVLNGKSPKTGKYIQFYTDSEIININSASTIDKSQITGGTLNKDQRELATLLKKDPKTAHQKFINSHPNSLISLEALHALGGSFPNLSVVEPLFNSLSEDIRSSGRGITYAGKITEWKKVIIGAYAPAFTMPDTAGKPISLSDFKGKYVLLDFWASWCPPCRAESPFLTAALKAYQDRNFSILGISLDNPRTGKEGWLKAIKDDQLTWPQVSDLKYENEVARLYSVSSIPQNFLLDPDGKIIAKNLRGEELGKKLKELLNP